MRLELGAKGDAVRRLQLMLNDALRPGMQLKVDGNFGERTEAAVSEFQLRKKLETDGVVGPATWAALGQRETKATQPTVVDSVGAPWLDIAKLERGVKVDSRPEQHHQHILNYHKTTTLKATTDEVAWCAAFVNWCLIQAKKTGCNSAAAIDWLDWGQKLEVPRVGAITIIHNKKKSKVRDASTGSASGNHVSFFISKSSAYITLFGGNQHSQVKQSTYELDKFEILGYRWPVG